MLAAAIFNQNNGDTTKAYYASLAAKGYNGLLAVALFRAQKRSTAAKRYRGRQYKNAAYDVKNWSLRQVIACLAAHNYGYEWGWGYDAHTPGFNHVLYVDLPTGQCSFHSDAPITTTERGGIKRYSGKWNPGDGSEAAILRFCDSVMDPTYTAAAERRQQIKQEAATQISMFQEGT